MDSIGLVWGRMVSHFRMGHWRGRGVHSPFAYCFTRKVFMERRHASCSGDIYDLLSNVGVRRETSRLVQAAYTYLECGAYGIGSFASSAAKNVSSRCALHVFTPETEEEIGKDWPDETVICLVSPFRNAAWYETCLKAIAAHEGMSIDCRSVIFLFFFKGLNKEYIKL